MSERISPHRYPPRFGGNFWTQFGFVFIRKKCSWISARVGISCSHRVVGWSVKGFVVFESTWINEFAKIISVTPVRKDLRIRVYQFSLLLESWILFFPFSVRQNEQGTRVPVRTLPRCSAVFRTIVVVVIWLETIRTSHGWVVGTYLIGLRQLVQRSIWLALVLWGGRVFLVQWVELNY